MENGESEQVTRCSCCKQPTDEEHLVLCDGCDRAYHTYCMTGCDCCGKVPNRQFKKVMEVPEGDWYCKHCRDHLPALAAGETPKTMMYGWGNNQSGCLGSGLAKEVISSPTLLSEVEGSTVKSFGAGDNASILVDDKGAVYTCGDGTNGQLGHQDIVHETLDHFRRVDFFQSGKISKGEGPIVKVIASSDNMYAVTRAGHLYGWGGNMQGELGHMDYKPKRLPKKNSAFREMNVQVKELVAGDHHALVLSDEPQVYAMGENTQRQLGVSNNSLEWTPKVLCQEWKHDRTVVEDPDIPRGVVRIFAGGNTSVCIDRKDRCYLWGLDILHRSKSVPAQSPISFVSTRSIIPYPQLVDLFSFPLKDLAIGEQHMVAIDTSGNVYAAGDNTKGQCASTGGYVMDFQKVDVPAGMTGVFAMGNVSGCYGKEGVFMWGDAESPLMAVFADKTQPAKPKQVPGLENVTAVKASNTHILVVCEVKEGNEMKEEEKPAEDKPAEVKPAEDKPEVKPAEEKPTEANPTPVEQAKTESDPSRKRDDEGVEESEAKKVKSDA